MKAISIMFTLVIDHETKRLFQEVEIVYESGAVRTLKLESGRSLRIDLDHIYLQGLTIPPSPT